jgi:hypothetical protein
MWALTSKTVKKHNDKDEILDCLFTYNATSSCYVKAADASITSKIWFTTPAFDRDMIKRLESIQLIAHSRLHYDGSDSAHNAGTQAESYSWFDIVVLDSPASETPKIINGLSMVWLSHNITALEFEREPVPGQCV